MKTLILYGRRNVGMCMLPFLVAKGYKVKVISDDGSVLWMAQTLGMEIVGFDTMGEFDLFICVHGNRILDKKYLVEGKMINIHPCLYKYKGHNPIKRYILNEDESGTVESQYLIEDVDEGETIYEVGFNTGKVKTFAEFYNEALKYYFLCLDKTLNILGI